MMKEIELAKPVAEWLRESGYIVYSEIPYYNRCIDMVGLRDEFIRIVELKLRFSAKGIWQAQKCQLVTEDIFLAVGKKPMDRTLSKYRRYGVGIVLVNDNVTILQKPEKIIEPWSYAAKHLRENCRATEPSDIAGLPCMSGCGPAQAVLAFIEGYVKENPKASWLQIWQNVPNHYSNYKSMACAMSSYLKMPLGKIKKSVLEQGSNEKAIIY